MITPRREIFWPAFVITLLLVTMTGSISVLFIAKLDGGAKIVDDYYKTSLNWDAKVAQETANQKLGWQIKVLQIQDGSQQKAPTRLIFQFNDAQNQPLQGIEGKLTAVRPDLGAQFHAVLEAGEKGQYRAGLNLPLKGLWDLTLELTQGENHFTHKVRVETL